MSDDDPPGSHERWAHLRFSVVGGLLASPPEKGDLRAELIRLAERSWRHPVTGQPVPFGLSTIERWYYAALRVQNPVAAPHRRRGSSPARNGLRTRGNRGTGRGSTGPCPPDARTSP